MTDINDRIVEAILGLGLTPQASTTTIAQAHQAGRVDRTILDLAPPSLRAEGMGMLKIGRILKVGTSVLQRVLDART